MFSRIICIPAGSSRLLGQVHPDLGQVVVVGLGQPGQGVDQLEMIDLGKTKNLVSGRLQ